MWDKGYCRKLYITIDEKGKKNKTEKLIGYAIQRVNPPTGLLRTSV
jgi:hypothetical protein